MTEYLYDLGIEDFLNHTEKAYKKIYIYKRLQN